MYEERNKDVVFKDLGFLNYKECWEYQESLFNAIVQKKINNRIQHEQGVLVTEKTDNYLLFVEHPHVFTLGKSGDESHLLSSFESLNKLQADYYKINRGGDITYHGPGQLVAYPILDLENFFTDIHKYLRNLEEVIILTLSDYGIHGERSPGETGVWLDAAIPPKARKICAFGVRSSRWVTMHGWGFNVNTDLSYFKNIIPCGITDKSVTSMQQELGFPLPLEEVKEKLKYYFSQVFECTLI